MRAGRSFKRQPEELARPQNYPNSFERNTEESVREVRAPTALRNFSPRSTLVALAVVDFDADQGYPMARARFLAPLVKARASE